MKRLHIVMLILWALTELLFVVRYFVHNMWFSIAFFLLGFTATLGLWLGWYPKWFRVIGGLSLIGTVMLYLYLARLGVSSPLRIF